MASFSTSYQDSLEPLNKNVPLPDKIRAIHRVLADRLGDIDRIAAALYDPQTDLLKTFVDSSHSDDHPLHHYQAPLAEFRSRRSSARADRASSTIWTNWANVPAGMSGGFPSWDTPRAIPCRCFIAACSSVFSFSIHGDGSGSHRMPFIPWMSLGT